MRRIIDITERQKAKQDSDRSVVLMVPPFTERICKLSVDIMLILRDNADPADIEDIEKELKAVAYKFAYKCRKPRQCANTDRAEPLKSSVTTISGQEHYTTNSGRKKAAVKEQ